jgi:hypothetical protein
MTSEITGVHPLADLFPMVAEDLPALAADIKANGLRHKLLVTPEGLLVDGRRRRAACELVGIDLECEIVNGNAVDLILSLNVHRRSLTKGQIAVIAVCAQMGITPSEIDSILKVEGDHHLKGGKRNDFDYLTQAHRRVEKLVSPSMIEKASRIVRWAPDYVQRILATSDGWSEAYMVAVDRSKAANNDESRRQLLAADSPDLLAQVGEGGLALVEAWQIREKRIRDERETRARHTGYLVDRVSQLLGKSNPAELIEHYDPEIASRRIGVAELDEAIQYLQALRSEMKRQKKG